MSRAPGCAFTEYLAVQLSSDNVAETLQVIDRLGGFLGEFHNRYDNHQHGDFTPSNVFYDQPQGKFTLIDVSGIAPVQHGYEAETDSFRFNISMNLCYSKYGPLFAEAAPGRFTKSYKAVT